MREYSDIFKHYYEAEDVILIYNTKQAYFYVLKNCPLVDLFCSNGTLVFAFDRAVSKPLYDKWCRHDLT